MKLLSIIVPVYNVEQYVEKCILSIVQQAVPNSWYELIVVNDGSTDTSRNILGKLQKQYPFIRIVDKENGGLSSARNEGLKMAQGEYIYFIDSDDWISEDSLSFILAQIRTYPSDIHLFGAQEVYDNRNGQKLLSSLSPDNQILTIANYLNNYTLRSSAWQGIFKRELFLKANYQFKHGFLAEDDDFVVRIFSEAKDVVCNSKIIYFYYQRDNSISKNKDDSVNEKLISDKFLMLEELNYYIQKYDEELKLGLQRKLNFLAVDIIRLLIRKNHSPECIRHMLPKMKAIDYFPLKKADYSFKYKLFRFIFSTEKRILAGRRFKNYI